MPIYKAATRKFNLTKDVLKGGCRMNINSILSTFWTSGISTDYNVAKSNLVSKKSTQDLMGEDAFSSSRTSIMARESYDYSSKVSTLSKIKREVEANDVQNSEAAGGTDETQGTNGGGSDDNEAKTETEVKVINGQAYMVITTTNEDGSKTIRNIKMGGSLAKGNDKLNTGDSLADAVTM